MVSWNTGESLSAFFSFRQCFLPCVQLRFPLSKLLFSDRILFLAGTNHRKRDEHRKNKSFFISGVNSINSILVFCDSDERSGRPTASQTKLNVRAALVSLLV